MSDHEILKQFILDSRYEIETDLENLIVKCFLYYNGYIEDSVEEKYIPELNLDYVEDCIEFAKEIGLREFDYWG